MHEFTRPVAELPEMLNAALAGRYRIERTVGSGGMATVYLAEDLRHHRKVAIKVLRPDLTATVGTQRFLREIDVAAQLQHPNILPLLDSGEAGGFLFYVMPYVEGLSLRERLANQGRLAVQEAVRELIEIVDALDEAHRQGIVHRDIKPGNVLLTGRHAVVADFGIAKALDDATGGQILTSAGIALGTPTYMAPEQAVGDTNTDHRVDIYAVGVLAYEMLTGSPPFARATTQAVLAAQIVEKPVPPHTLYPFIPVELSEIVLKCLRKKPDDRWQSAKELLDQLESFAHVTGSSRSVQQKLRSGIRKPGVVIATVVAAAILIAFALWIWERFSRARWARTVALPTITRMIDSGNYYSAFMLTREARKHLADDSQLQSYWRTVAVPVSIRTTPPGVDIFVKDYGTGTDSSKWNALGRSPLDSVPVPIGSLRWKLKKNGFSDVEAATVWAGALFDTVRFTLHTEGATPPGMVFVPASPVPPGLMVPDSWIDKYEVTNRQFQDFVNAGGYQRREFWKEPFVTDGKVLSWDQAIARFRDTTGRPGPSTWELGRYPDGEGEFPVTGVSWYEAVAYAEFSGKSLPVFGQWARARIGRQPQLVESMMSLSNFGGKGPARVGSHRGIGASGTYDMAGNAREWCWNKLGDKRCSLGGGWDDPTYTVQGRGAMPPFDRSRNQGFRLARYSAPLPEGLLAPLTEPPFSVPKPVSDEVFEAYRRVYAYERADLAAKVESVDESSPLWREEKISFNAAYGGQRMMAHLFLPRNATPPYQVVVYFPGGAAQLARSISFLDEAFSNFVVRSGRALLYPIYNNTYQRRQQPTRPGISHARDLGIEWSKDFGRSIDYLETRQDIDLQKVAFYGFSQGPHWGTIFMALDNRVKVGVFLAGGLQAGLWPPESNPLNFAPRVLQPVLMINGKHDSVTPLETSQLPLFRLLGSTAKRHVVVPNAGHVVPRQSFVKEILTWLDHHLGTVRTGPLK